MRMKKFVALATLSLGFFAVAASTAYATVIANFKPIGTASNTSLAGLNLSSNNLVTVRYLVPGLSTFGNLKATYTLSATETGAIAFGPLSLASFDGSFSLTYAGPNVTHGAITIHTGADLLSGTFLGSVFTGYGSSANLTDSVVAGGLVSYNNNSFLSFDPTADEGLALSMTGLKPSVQVVTGQLTGFSAVESGNFSATVLGGTAPLRFDAIRQVPEPVTLSFFGAGLAGLGALRRRRKKLATAAALAAGLTVAGISGANADTFAAYGPASSASDMSLTGLTLSDSSSMLFDYQVPGLSNFGDLSATFNLSATETGAIAFGPISLATFDGTFSFAYAGADITVGSVTIHTGDDLLSGTFLGSVFTGYGSSAGLVDSILGGGLVSFNDNNLLTFDPTGDQAIALALTDVAPSTQVVTGQLTDFSGTSSGNFAADILTNACGVNGGLCGVQTTPTPEPITLSLFGAGVAGAVAMRRRKKKTA